MNQIHKLLIIVIIHFNEKIQTFFNQLTEIP